MSIKLKAPEINELKPRITVLGVGGAGGNAVNNMINARLEGVSFVVANTDAQALALSKADRKIQLGAQLTEGLGAGAKPDVGRGAAEESINDILEHLGGSHMVFITAGMGGGTGTGAAPVIARAVRELGVLTVGVVTKPFQFEGDRRMRVAEEGIEELQSYVDTLIIIPNQNLFRVANERTTFAQAFAMADDVLHSGVRGVTDLIVMPGLINRDFADIKTVMSEMGKAMMGTGEMDGEGRALRAAEAAISNPLLEDVSMKGARAVLINVTGGPDLMLFEVDEAVNRIRAEVDPEANILFGSALSDSLEGRVRVSVVATGIGAEAVARATPDNVQPLRPRLKPVEIDAPAPAPAPAPAATPMQAEHPVHKQAETIAQRFSPPLLPVMQSPAQEDVRHAVPSAPDMAPPFTLGGVEAPEVPDETAYPVRRREMARVEPLTPVPQEKKRFSGLFGARKRAEPAANYGALPPQMRAPLPQAAPAAPRADAAPAPAYAPPPRAAEPAPVQRGTSDDLFGGMKEDDRFEIPAFLRRQANANK